MTYGPGGVKHLPSKWQAAIHTVTSRVVVEDAWAVFVAANPGGLP
jgi:hypothetical protein